MERETLYFTNTQYNWVMEFLKDNFIKRFQKIARLLILIYYAQMWHTVFLPMRFVVISWFFFRWFEKNNSFTNLRKCEILRLNHVNGRHSSYLDLDVSYCIWKDLVKRADDKAGSNCPRPKILKVKAKLLKSSSETLWNPDTVLELITNATIT